MKNASMGKMGAGLALLGAMLFLASPAHAKETYECGPTTPTPGSTVYSDLEVKKNEICNLSDVTVNGNVTADAGSTLNITDSTVNGTLSVATDAMSLAGSQVNGNATFTAKNGTAGTTICGDTIFGNVTIDGEDGKGIAFGVSAAQMCDSGTYALGNIVNGTLTAEDSKSAVSILEDTVQGNVSITGNKGTVGFGGNTVNGKLSCSTNNPAPVNDAGTDGPNTISGKETGQCAGF